MIYLKIYWVIIILLFLIHGIAYLIKSKELNELLDKYAFLVLILAFSFLVVAIVTNDPINFLGMNISTELQWIVSLFTVGFGSWKWYLKPLKERVIECEKDIREIKTTLRHIENTLERILNHLKIN